MSKERSHRPLATALLGGIAAIGLAAAAHAATQGNPGATSTGTVAISAIVNSQVRISGLSDVTFSTLDPSVDALSHQDVCVWSNTATKGYKITASGSGTANAFTLASASVSALPYHVEWDDTAGQSSGTALVSGTALTGQTSTATSSSCNSNASPTASLVVKILTGDLQAATEGVSYTGTLTLVVAPE